DRRNRGVPHHGAVRRERRGGHQQVAPGERGGVELQRLDRWIEGEGLRALDESAVRQGERAEEEKDVGRRDPARAACGVEEDGRVLPEAGNRDAARVVGIGRYG